MLEVLEQLVKANTLQQVWQLHCNRMATFGFDRLIYGYTRFATPNSVGELMDAVFLTNHDPGYFAQFIEERMFLHAPLTRWARENDSGYCSWGALWQHPEELTQKELEVIAFNRQMGVTAGYTVAVPTPSDRSHALFALTGQPDLTQGDLDVIWADKGKEIEVMCNLTHLKIASLPIETNRPKLSRRQLEVLEWVAEGKSNQDVATIMGVSVPTIEKHLRLAREKLGVDTTAQAIAKITFLNQFHVRSSNDSGSMKLNDEADEGSAVSRRLRSNEYTSSGAH
ncbi:MAG: helix-turn-helix transcriptional regulator [Maritimibacter harenae]|jgi:LuxR family transcriptional regulator|uniref:LuxR family transcriptional regulator n=1 Tax=Maritimibacter harenae TaxID=2606218 RepID=A0A845M8Z4_9RHOB|nr:LuxR family transcriptional regulator [Maritimibacter harenae]MZR13254.1 LuxR family transcriptional regulator [Maritimibacter harenae]